MIRLPFLAALVFLAAAATGYAAVKNPDTFVLARNVEVQSLDPAFTYGGSERAALYGRIQDRADEELPDVPLANGFEFRAQRSWVRGFVFNPMSPGLPENSYYYDLYKAE